MTRLLKDLKLRAAQWNVEIEETRETEGALLGFGLTQGKPVVLKITSFSDEKNCGAVLRAFQGAGTVRVYEADPGGVLLERLEPATELVELVRAGQDDEATSILAKTISHMANHEPPPNCPTVFDWGRGFDRYLSEYNDGPVPIQ